jgi:hypothetical protein
MGKTFVNDENQGGIMPFVPAIPNLNLTISTQSRQDAKILTLPRRNRQEYHLAQGQS